MTDIEKGSAVMQAINRPNQRQVGVKPVPGKEPTKFSPVKKAIAELTKMREELDKGIESSVRYRREKANEPKHVARREQQRRAHGAEGLKEMTKGDEMEEVEKDMKGPESPGVKKPGKIPLSANRSAITEEPADRSSTSQNYKNTPDMNKAITKSDEAALKKCITDATTIIKAMSITLEKGILSANRSGRGNLRSIGDFVGGRFPTKSEYAENSEAQHRYAQRPRETLKTHGRDKVGRGESHGHYK